MGARQASGVEPGASHMAGQFDPLRLAWLIAQRHPNSGGTNPRQLVQVSIYRGLPSSSVDPVGYGAVRRQVARWRSSSADGGPQLDINLRPLDYSLGRPREKGIDVLLALDLAFGAAHGAFDVAVLFSGDSDLLPALERVSASGVQCETASWRGGGRRLPKKSFIRWEHRLTQLDYRAAHDPIDYRPSMSSHGR